VTAQRNNKARIVKNAIASIEATVATDEITHRLADLVRLLQIEKELEADPPREIRGTWIDSVAMAPVTEQ
jgi:hypothetical protein